MMFPTLAGISTFMWIGFIPLGLFVVVFFFLMFKIASIIIKVVFGFIVLVLIIIAVMMIIFIRKSMGNSFSIELLNAALPLLV